MKKYWIIILLAIGLQLSVDKAYSQLDISITASIAPPDLPVYDQPACPADGYMWTPGYWAYGDGDYYWVPGVWVSPPHFGYLWTPFYWGFENGIYGLHNGYWGRHIGFYGGVNYGYGYGGHGFGGGRWEGNHFRYNTAVMNVNTTIIHNTYIDRTVMTSKNRGNDHRSFNGGDHGTRAKPTIREQSTMKEHHVAPTNIQISHVQTASHNTNQFAAVNHGKPANAAVSNVKGSNFGQKSNPARVTNASTPPHQQVASPHIQGGNNNVPQKNHTATPMNPIHQTAPAIPHNNFNQSAVHSQQSTNKPVVNQYQQQSKPQQPARQNPQPIRQQQQPARPQQPQRQPQQQAPHQARPAQEEHGRR